MFKFKNQLTFLGINLLLILFLSTKSFGSYIMICFGPGNNNCFITEGTCDGWCPDAPKDPNCTQGLSAFLNPDTDYILFQGGVASVVTKNQKYPIASDNLANYVKSINKKYASIKKFDPSQLAKIQAEYKNYLRTDNKKVNSKRVALLSKETGLAIRKNSSK